MTVVVADAFETPAPPEEVWKLLYDPARFASWWKGVRATEADGDGSFLLHAPDGVLRQRLHTDAAAGRVVVSCLVRGVEFHWTLTPLDGGGTRIGARCELPTDRANQAPAQRAAIAASLRRLAELAATDAPPARG